jgi:hypothetical protein
VGDKGVYEGYVYHFPGLDRNSKFDLRPFDLAVIILDKQVRGVKPVTLAEIGALDDLQKSNSEELLTAVSYGPATRDPSTWDFARRTSEWRLAELKGSTFVHFQGPPYFVCDGDQGAPFLDTAGKVTALITFWPGFCNSDSVAYGYRVDTQEARDFLCDVGTEPLLPVADPNNNVEGDFVNYPPIRDPAGLLCSGGGAAARSASADDGGKQGADRNHNGNKGGKQRNRH